MSTTTAVKQTDLTATARIRDAAIELFGQYGFGVGLRAIADPAGVSAALVLHHFGSKARLRRACSEHVFGLIRDTESDAVPSMWPKTWFARLAEIEWREPMLAFVMRSLESGDELGRALMRQMIDDTERCIAEAVRAGSIKASSDPEGRARYLTLTGVGGALLYRQMHDEPTDVAAVLHDYAEEMALPALELCTQGVVAET
jgi:AcrR family transcriptional regulator